MTVRRTRRTKKKAQKKSAKKSNKKKKVAGQPKRSTKKTTKTAKTTKKVKAAKKAKRSTVRKRTARKPANRVARQVIDHSFYEHQVFAARDSYSLVESTDPSELVKQVQIRCNEGWATIGGVCHSGSQFYQAMVKSR